MGYRQDGKCALTLEQYAEVGVEDLFLEVRIRMGNKGKNVAR